MDVGHTIRIRVN